MINRMMLVMLKGVGWYNGFASAKACLHYCRTLNATHEVTGRAGAVVNHNGSRLTIVLHLLLRSVLR